MRSVMRIASRKLRRSVAASRYSPGNSVFRCSLSPRCHAPSKADHQENSSSLTCEMGRSKTMRTWCSSSRSTRMIRRVFHPIGWQQSILPSTAMALALNWMSAFKLVLPVSWISRRLQKHQEMSEPSHPLLFHRVNRLDRRRALKTSSKELQGEGTSRRSGNLHRTELLCSENFPRDIYLERRKGRKRANRTFLARCS